VISKPAETVFLKRLRELRLDLSALDLSHIDSGGLYLLELFVRFLCGIIKKTPN